MTVHEQAIAKLKELPEGLVQEVSDFIDFISLKRDSRRWQLLAGLRESVDLAESDFSDYLSNLEAYEEQLARGEISR